MVAMARVENRGVPALAVVLLAATGCRGCNSEGPRPQATEAAAPATAMSAPPALALDAYTASTDAGPAAGSRAFLVRFGPEFVPLGCFDAAKRQLRGGAGCVDLIASDPRVGVLESAAPHARVRARPVKLAVMTFEGADEGQRGFRLDVPCLENGERVPPCWEPEGDGGEHAVWPVSTFGRFKLVPPFDPTPELPPEVAAEMEGIARKIGFPATPPVAVAQRLQVDLDGDGKRETLLCVALDSSGGPIVKDADVIDLPAALHYLFISRNKGPFARAPLPPRNDLLQVDGDAKVRGVMDLDGDGGDELWMQNSYMEGGTSMVVHWRDGMWQILGSVTAGQ